MGSNYEVTYNERGERGGEVGTVPSAAGRHDHQAWKRQHCNEITSKDSKSNPIGIRYQQRRSQAHDSFLAYQWSTLLVRDTTFLPRESVPQILNEVP